MTIEIVDLPSYKMVIFYSYVSLPEGTTGSFSQYKHRAAVAGSDFPMERSRTAPTAATTVMAASLSHVPMTHVTRERWWSSWADKTCETWWNYGEIMVNHLDFIFNLQTWKGNIIFATGSNEVPHSWTNFPTPIWDRYLYQPFCKIAVENPAVPVANAVAFMNLNQLQIGFGYTQQSWRGSHIHIRGVACQDKGIYHGISTTWCGLMTMS